MRTTMRMPAAATLAVTLAASSAPTVARAQSDTPLKGLWKLVSYEVEIRKDGETLPVMGEHPTGYAYFTPEKRVFFVLTGEGRKPAKDDAQRAQLLETLVSYTGKFRLDGDKWIADLDVAWDPKWVGTEQTPHVHARRRAPAGADPLAGHAELGRQGRNPQHRDLRAREGLRRQGRALRPSATRPRP